MPVSKRLPLLTWNEHVNNWKDCKRCDLGSQRDRIVLARGTVPCDVLFVGEAPGDSENAIGQPFVDSAGNKLDTIIKQALPPDIKYAMTNIVACYPREAKMFGGSYEPFPEEIRACRPRLMEFVNLCRPKLIVRVGQLAASSVYYKGAKFVDIDHPAYILRMPLAQRNMAAQRCIVILRNAVSDMVLLGYPNFTIGREEHASVISNGYIPSETPF